MGVSHSWAYLPRCLAAWPWALSSILQVRGTSHTGWNLNPDVDEHVSPVRPGAHQDSMHGGVVRFSEQPLHIMLDWVKYSADYMSQS